MTDERGAGARGQNWEVESNRPAPGEDTVLQGFSVEGEEVTGFLHDGRYADAFIPQIFTMERFYYLLIGSVIKIHI